MRDKDNDKRINCWQATVVWSFIILWAICSILQITTIAIFADWGCFSSSTCALALGSSVGVDNSTNAECKQYICQLQSNNVCQNTIGTGNFIAVTIVGIAAILIPIFLVSQLTCCGTSVGQIYRAIVIFSSRVITIHAFVFMFAWLFMSCYMMVISHLNATNLIIYGIFALLVWLMSSAYSDNIAKRSKN
jgi:hypothetical protein